jgi:hypothetical protein
LWGITYNFPPGEKFLESDAMYVVVWEPSGRHGGGHQVTLTKDRAETVQRAISRALPDVKCWVQPADIPPAE